MRIVIKIGSSTLVKATGELDTLIIESLCCQAATLTSEGHEVIIVSSGAAASGMGRLGFGERPSDLPTLMALSSAGQAALTELYAASLAKHDIACAQVLLTRADIAERTSYLNARSTLERLLELRAIPVVNENNAVASAEFNFGDNDTLGGIVATLVGADLYIILSDIEGLMDKDPAHSDDAKLISSVEKITPELRLLAGPTSSSVGVGGMSSKLRVAQAMLVAGIPMVICYGRQDNVVLDVVHGKQIGTRFEAPEATHEGARKFWFGLAGVSKGTVCIDDGARNALITGGGSLLPVGISQVRGHFEAGDIVSVVDSTDELIARGVTRYSSEEIDKIRGLKLDVVSRFYPEREGVPCIHRDEMLVF